MFETSILIVSVEFKGAFNRYHLSCYLYREALITLIYVISNTLNVILHESYRKNRDSILSPKIHSLLEILSLSLSLKRNDWHSNDESIP